MTDKPEIKIEVVKTYISVPPRKISANWAIEDFTVPKARKKPETPEEEAEEIIRRLKAPPTKPRSIEDEMADELAKMIQEEIDKEILEELMKCQKKK